MIQDICQHSIDTSLLKAGDAVIDAGCRDWQFSTAMTKLGCRVFSIDADLVSGGNGSYYHCALSNKEGSCGLVHTSDPNCKYIADGNEIQMHTIASFSRMVNVNWWSVIKLDIEGSEYDILRDLKQPIATQLSIEFHEHTAKRIGKGNVESLLEGLKQWYDVVYSPYDARHGANYGMNFWDTLLVLKQECRK